MIPYYANDYFHYSQKEKKIMPNQLLNVKFIQYS